MVPGARASIRSSHLATGRRVLVLDDDPTGSQAVHGVEAVTVIDTDADRQGASSPIPAPPASSSPTAGVFPTGEATALADRLGRFAAELEARLGARIEVVSRSDSTLRGHVIAEVQALIEARRAVLGQQPYDGVVLVPSYFEAGRFTASDVHWARTSDGVLAVGSTEFAKDASFGYSSSDLRQFLEEKSGGAILAEDVGEYLARRHPHRWRRTGDRDPDGAP